MSILNMNAIALRNLRDRLKRSGRSIPPEDDPRFGEQLRETILVGEGLSGDSKDAYVKIRDLQAAMLALTGAGVLEMTDEQRRRLAEADVGDLFGIDGSGQLIIEPSGSAVQVPVEGATANALFDKVMLAWSAPTYPGHAYTEVWFAEAADFGRKEFLQRVDPPGAMFTHQIGFDRDGYYWFKNVSVSGRESWSGPVHAKTDPDWAAMQQILSNQITTSTWFQDLESRIDLIDEEGGVIARLETVENLVEDGDFATAEQIIMLQASVDDNAALIQTNASAFADMEGNVNAQYTIKVDANGKIAGIGLFSSGVTSSVIVRADRFVIAPPAWSGSSKDTLPFVYDYNANTIYINNTVIKNASITAAQIQDGFLDNLTASHGTITAARIERAQFDMTYLSGDIGSGYLNYNTWTYHFDLNNNGGGGYGWRINRNGLAWFENVRARGHIEATSGHISGNVTIGGSATTISTLDSKVQEAEINSDAALAAAYYDGQTSSWWLNQWRKPGQVAISGGAIAATDVYVDTLNIKGQAVTVSVGAQKTYPGYVSVGTNNTAIMMFVGVPARHPSDPNAADYPVAIHAAVALEYNYVRVAQTKKKRSAWVEGWITRNGVQVSPVFMLAHDTYRSQREDINNDGVNESDVVRQEKSMYVTMMHLDKPPAGGVYMYQLVVKVSSDLGVFHESMTKIGVANMMATVLRR